MGKAGRVDPDLGSDGRGHSRRMCRVWWVWPLFPALTQGTRVLSICLRRLESASRQIPDLLPTLKIPQVPRGPRRWWWGLGPGAADLLCPGLPALRFLPWVGCPAHSVPHIQTRLWALEAVAPGLLISSKFGQAEAPSPSSFTEVSSVTPSPSTHPAPAAPEGWWSPSSSQLWNWASLTSSEALQNGILFPARILIDGWW